MARYNLNLHRLVHLARDAAIAVGLGSECRNPFRSIMVRAVEVVYVCVTRHCGSSPSMNVPTLPPSDAIVVTTGHGCTESTTVGILYHRYRLDGDGMILERADHSTHVAEPSDDPARPMASRGRLARRRRRRRRRRARRRCEQAIRNYYLCILCATHFLDLTVHRT